jgi:hypothetical protein
VKQKKSIAAGLIALGVIIIAGALLWSETRILEPLAVRIPLAKGHREYSFRTNVTYRYTVNLDVEKGRMTEGEIDCTYGTNLGVFTSRPDCGAIRDLFKIRWTLTEHGRPIAHYSSTDNDPGAWIDRKSFVRVLGSFYGVAGSEYVLDVNILQDAQAIAVTPPLLNVDVGIMYVETGDLYLFLLESLGGISIFGGLVLFGGMIWQAKHSFKRT